MPSISPRIAAELADVVYGIIKPRSGNYTFGRSRELDQHFDFDLSNGPIQGASGGFLGFFEKISGFALVGYGKGRYLGDHVIAIRGTQTGQDWLTNGNVGLATGHGGSSVHSGFNQTFESMSPSFEKILTPRLTSSARGTVHCVGHSLGGALASLTADWIKTRYRREANLYTFGAPRVGLNGYATNATFSVAKMFRCTHGADPVPNVPLWPFIHAPNCGTEYRLDQGQGISVAAHSMKVEATPGYRNTANRDDWKSLQKSSLDFLSRPVRLKYENRHQASFTGYWAEQINAALVTLLKDSGHYTAIVAQAGIGTALTFYDLVARTLEQVAKASASFAEQTAGLLGHMLVFAGQVATAVVNLTYQFIRWVFGKTINALYRSVKQALDRIQVGSGSLTLKQNVELASRPRQYPMLRDHPSPKRRSFTSRAIRRLRFQRPLCPAGPGRYRPGSVEGSSGFASGAAGSGGGPSATTRTGKG